MIVSGHLLFQKKLFFLVSTAITKVRSGWNHLYVPFVLNIDPTQPTLILVLARHLWSLTVFYCGMSSLSESASSSPCLHSSLSSMWCWTVSCSIGRASFTMVRNQLSSRSVMHVITLSKKSVPRFALANGLYRGELPIRFHNLTWVEEKICAIYCTTAHVTRLFQSSDPSQPKIFYGKYLCP